MRYVLLLLIAFPAYATPVCNEPLYEPMKLAELNRNLEDIINDKEPVCLVEYIWGNYIEKDAMLGVVGGGGGGGMIDLSPLSGRQRREIQSMCQGQLEICLYAVYGTVVWSKKFRNTWLLVPDKVVTE